MHRLSSRHRSCLRVFPVDLPGVSCKDERLQLSISTPRHLSSHLFSLVIPSPPLTPLSFLHLTAAQFHLLTVAQSILLDGPKRAALDVKLDEKRKRAARTAGLESRKRGLVNVRPLLSFQVHVSRARLTRCGVRDQDLVAREEAFKKQRSEAAGKAAQSHAESAIQSEGKAMREAAEAAVIFQEMELKRARDNALNSKGKEAASVASQEGDLREVQDRERTLRLSLPLPTFATAVASTDALKSFLAPQYGLVLDAVILPSKPPKKKKSLSSSSSSAGSEVKEVASAMVVFPGENLAGCWALWEDCRVGRGQWKGVKCKWTTEGGLEPSWVGRLGRQPPTSTSSSSPPFPSSSSPAAPPRPTSSSSSATPAPSFSFDPDAIRSTPAPTTSASGGVSERDYESATLLRMRQAERERLEREILEQDAMDE